MGEINPVRSKLARRYGLEKCIEQEARVVDQWFNSIPHEIIDRLLGDHSNQIGQRIWENIQLVCNQGRK